MKVALLVLAAAFGGLLIYLGGYDDSPGLQLIGLLVALASIVGAVRSWKK